MKIWCLANDQLAHVQPVEAAFGGAAQFIYDKAADPAALLREAPDLVLCVNDYPCDVLRCLDAARSRRIPSLVLQDGILEWRCQYQNPLFGAGGGAPQHQPVMADKIACLGRQSARQIAAWNSAAKVEVTGMPRLDFLFARSFPAARKPGQTLLVMTAKNPGFTPEQREVTVRSLRELQAYLKTRPEIKVLWRVSKAVAQELGVENHLRQISSLELVQVLDQADAVITTPSTAMLEAMIAGRPVAALDYHNVPRFVPTAWTISGSDHRAAVVDELLNPPGAKMAFQQDCLRDCLASDGHSAQRVARLIDKMVAMAKASPPSGPLVFPANLLSGPEALPDAARPPLAALYEGHGVFRESNLEALQVRLARAENENSRLKTQVAELKKSGQIGSLLKRGMGRLAGHRST